MEEVFYTMERADGMLVRVPASKLGEFDPNKTEPTPEEKRYAKGMAQRLLKHRGQVPKNSGSPKEPPKE